MMHGQRNIKKLHSFLPVKGSVLCKIFYLSLSKSVQCCVPPHKEMVVLMESIQGLGGVCTNFGGLCYGVSTNEPTEITEEVKISCPHTDRPSPTYVFLFHPHTLSIH